MPDVEFLQVYYNVFKMSCFLFFFNLSCEKSFIKYLLHTPDTVQGPRNASNNMVHIPCDTFSVLQGSDACFMLLHSAFI